LSGVCRADDVEDVASNILRVVGWCFERAPAGRWCVNVPHTQTILETIALLAIAALRGPTNYAVLLGLGSESGGMKPLC